MEATAQKQEVHELNGVDLDALQETMETIKENPELAVFKFRNQNEWIMGGHNQSIVKPFYGACQEDTSRKEEFVVHSDEPAVLLSTGKAPNSVEYLLHALSSCVTTSIVYHAAARGLKIDTMKTKCEGEINIKGFLGMSTEIEKGYKDVDMDISIKTNATEEQLRECMNFSPVYEMISMKTPVNVNFNIY